MPGDIRYAEPATAEPSVGWISRPGVDCGPPGRGFEPRLRRLATVAWPEPGRPFGGNRSAQGLASWRAAAGMEGDGRWRKLLILCDLAGTPLHAWSAGW